MRVGCDVVNLVRFRKLIEQVDFLQRVFHPLEIEECGQRRNPAPSYAARFAVKEAFSKALGTGLLTRGVEPLDVWTRKTQHGRPYVDYKPHVAKIMQSIGCSDADVSISHDGDYAMATVILL